MKKCFTLAECVAHVNLLANVKFGFTLAEVLITLGIIGIVAALTIPGLITKCKEMQYRVTYKKVYSSLNQAMKYAQEDDGVDLTLGNTIFLPNLSGGVTPHTSNVGEIFKYISRYYKATTTCFDKNADKCWVCEKGEAGYIPNGAPDWLGCSKSSYAFIDANGVAYYLYDNTEFPVLIDVNGDRKPNQLGRDRFVMFFGNSFEPHNTYPDTVNAVLLYEDIKGKQRWCPQGDCLYKTWVRNGKW